MVKLFQFLSRLLITFCKRFGPRSGSTKVGSDLDSNLIKQSTDNNKKSLQNHTVGKSRVPVYELFFYFNGKLNIDRGFLPFGKH